ncbi:MAG: DUF6498-containing protein [Chitinophagales bacterium]|nr:DUF6498-containing protein [Chitinophagales bacterium]
MKIKQIFSDRSFWSLLVINLAIIAYYLYYGTGFKTLVWIYWCQSVIIGFSNFLNLATVRNIKPGFMTINDEPVTTDGQARGCLAPFFAVHYGGFHLAYFVFLFTITDANERVDFGLLEASVGAMLLDQAWNFFRAKQWEKEYKTNPGTLFFLPYLRIVPMHLTILLPAFLKTFSHLTIFLILKTVADMLMYAITLAIYGKPGEDDPTVLRNSIKYNFD